MSLARRSPDRVMGAYTPRSRTTDTDRMLTFCRAGKLDVSVRMRTRWKMSIPSALDR